MKIKAFQEYFTEDFSHLYGFGTNNEFGHQLKIYWMATNDMLICSQEEDSKIDFKDPRA